MRFFLKLLFAIAIALVLTGLLTYPSWLLVSQFADYRADRVARRIGVLLLAIALVWMLRRAGPINRATFGYGLPRREFLRQMLIGFCAGIVLMLLLVAAFFALDLRVWNGAFTPTLLVLTLAEAIVAAFAVAFAEETLMRGAMFSGIERESGLLAATTLPSLLFAAGHFMFDPDKMRIAANDMSFVAGVKIAANAFADFAEPLAHIDAFLALFALGVLLSLIRARTGAIAGSVGVHAGGVMVIFLTAAFSSANKNAPIPALVGSYNNNTIGWLACIWISVVALAYWRISRRKMN